MSKIKYLPLLLLLGLLNTPLLAQEGKPSDLSKDDILSMSMEELSTLSLDDLMDAIALVGVSSIEELYELLLNKDVTSASKSEESLFDSPLSTTVLSQKEILSSGATSIEEALRLVPGIIVREKTNGNYDVQIRGGQNMPMNNMLIYTENTSTLVMVDGRPVFNYAMGGILWESLPVSLGELNRIEVVRGPSSALYGPNAVNGVINLITKDTDSSSPLVSANVQGGSNSTFIGDAHLQKALNDNVSFGISTYYEQRDRKDDEIYAFYTDEYLDLATYQQKNEAGNWSSGNIFNDFGDISLAKERKGINAYFDYKPNQHINFNFSAGYLESGAITSTIGDNPTPHSERLSEGFYTNLNASIYGFNLQINTNQMEQNFNRGHEGWIQESEQYNIGLDYLIKAGKVNIRPGMNYQSVYYDDRDHVKVKGNGYFNDRVVLRNYAASARFDYKPSDQLRFVAALRAEKYNVPDDWTPSYQFITSYKVNKNNLLRLVYSRSNQSTFLVNAFSDYTWSRAGSGPPETVYFGNNPDPDMMSMDMIELGYRTRLGKRLLIDIEAYYNKAKDYSALMPENTTADAVMMVPDPANSGQMIPYPVNSRLNISHQSLDLESKQFGLSLNADIIINEKLTAKTHLNYQQTKVDNFMDHNQGDVTEMQIMDIITQYMMGQSAPYTSTLQPDKSTFKDDVDNEALPSFWGMCELTYKPAERWSISGQGYYYGDYFMYTQYDSAASRLAIGNLSNTGNMDGKFILNAKVNYQLSEKMNLFINGRNILNNDQQEFIYMDKIGALYLAGINIRL
jgi:iron complex outermembrane receptor protein